MAAIWQTIQIHFLEKISILIQVSLRFVSTDPINNNSGSVW